jgi:hypothetical protein
LKKASGHFFKRRYLLSRRAGKRKAFPPDACPRQFFFAILSSSSFTALFSPLS